MNKDFFKSFEIDWTKIEFNNLNKIVDSNLWENIYFLWWVNLWTNKRASDYDIVKKNYFVIDLDLWNEYKRITWDFPTTADIIEEAKQIKKYLDKTDLFNEWSYINFSGRWIHIYYIWNVLEVEKMITKEQYSYWVQRIYRQFEKIFESKRIKPDYACRNIGRIMRCPWSINSKNWEECRVLYKQDKNSMFLNILQKLWVKEQQEEKEIEEKQREKYIKEQTERLNKLKIEWKNNLYEIINKEVPASLLTEELIGFQLAKNGKNFINEKWWFTWYWYDKQLNIIHNWWSTHYFTNKNWYNTFEIIKEFKNFTNYETFTYFKNRFKLW